MNDKFDELAKGLTQSVMRGLLWLVVAAQFARLACASDFRRGPLIGLSDPDPLANCPGGLGFVPGSAQEEPSLAVNPANPKNIVAAWIGGSAKGIVTAVTFDGGKRWQQVVIPGVNECSGGAFFGAVDPWVSFAPNGATYVVSLALYAGTAIGINKSNDGGLHWSEPIIVDANTDPRFSPDKPSITADATDSHYVYAAWEQRANGNRRFIGFARTTDGGVTWEPQRRIVDLGNSDEAQDAQILVMPDGTLVCVFVEVLFHNANGGDQKEAVLAVIRSTDKGLNWSAPVTGPRVPIFQATDPDNGVPYVNQNSYPPAVSALAIDPRNGNLYVAFEDTHFSGGQYADIAFTTSSDRGSTWSVPIPVNKAPTSIPAANRQAFIPTIAVASDGTIGVAYYDFRFNDASSGLLTDYWLVHCHPSATTPATNPGSWSSETRLTDVAFDLESALNLFGSYFLGDYMGLATAGNDFVAVFNQSFLSDPGSIFFRRVGP